MRPIAPWLAAGARAALASAVLLAGTWSGARAQPPLFGSTPAWTGPTERTLGIAFGDVDGDGDLDLVRGNDGQPATLHWNAGLGFEMAPAWAGPAEPTTSVALGDVDGDGDLDLVRGNFSAGTTLYVNVGGTFAANPSWTGPAATTRSVALGDVDRDGRLDLVCGNFEQGASLFLNTANGFGTTAAWTGPVASTSSIALGDVDGDGDLDLVCGNVGRAATLFLNSGGTFAATPAWQGPAEETWSVALGDVDGDGDLDLARGNLNQSTTVYANEGGTFGAAPTWTGPVENTVSLGWGDVDGDGDLDLVRGNANQGATVYTNDAGTLGSGPAWMGPSENTRCVALGDVDGDGDLDLMRGSGNSGATLYENTSGRFGLRPLWESSPMRTFSVALGDVDGDGDPDLVCGTVDRGPTLHVNEGGTFGADPTWSGLVANTWSVALGDVDGDGDLDLVCGNNNDNTAIYENAGGTFAGVPVAVGAVEDTWSVALADVDGDGDLDLVRGNGGGGTTLYCNRGGSFNADPVWTGPAENTRSVALADVDGDGRPDLVCGNLFGGATLYRNTGGSFDTTAAWTGPAENTRSVALGDVDGDGDVDLVRGNEAQGATLYLNDGQTFSVAAAWTGSALNTRSVALGDVDADGDLDLVVGASNEGATLYRNTGGSFTVGASWIGLAEDTWSVALGDVDGDGDADLLRGNDAQAVTWYRNLSPWLQGAPLVPSDRLPNDPAHLRWVGLGETGENRHQISCGAFDAEADPLWIVGEYQFAGGAVWSPMDFEGSTRVVGPLTTSRGGTPHTVEWRIDRLPIDGREVVVRLRAVSAPGPGGSTQFVPAYLASAGRVLPARPVVAFPQRDIAFAAVTVGDSLTVTLEVGNAGNRDLVIQQIETPDAALLPLATPPLVLVPGAVLQVPVLLAPRQPLPALGPLIIHSNDPAEPRVEIAVGGTIRPLVIMAQILTPAPQLPLGEAATVVVTPAPDVHVERGLVFYRTRGGAPAFADSTPLGRQGGIFVAVIPGLGVQEAGLEYYVRVENSGLFASDPAGAPDSVFFHPVASPAAISAAAQPDLAGEFPVGRATPIVVVLPPGSQFDSGHLFYRRGGGAAYDSVRLALGEPSPGVEAPVGVIPEEAVTAYGLEFWVRARTVTQTLTAPLFAPASSPLTQRTHIGDLAEDHVHEGGRYRMFSLPLELGVSADATLEAVLADEPEFGSADPARWRAFRYRPGTGSYLEVQAASAATGELRPDAGRAFWLVARSSHQVDTAPVAGRSTPTGGPYRITLEPGWNQVGNPYLFTVAWADVHAEDASGPVALEPPVGWDEVAQKYGDEDVALLRPFDGYWVRNPSSQPIALSIPPRESPIPVPLAPPSPKPASTVDAAGWQVRIAVTCGAHSDSRNAFGVHANARDGDDAEDRSDPPPAPGPAVSLYFLADANAASAGRAGARRTIDMRAPMTSAAEVHRGQRWVFDVARTGPEIEQAGLRLEFAGLESVPAGVCLQLFDRSLEAPVDLREQSAYTYVAGTRQLVDDPAIARFEILAGTPAFVDSARAQLATWAWQTRLWPASPSPMRGPTRLRFEVGHAGPVQVVVYDAAGRRVRVLVDGIRAAGRHEVLWQGDDGQGHRAAPGVYFVRLHAPGGSATRKLVKSR